MNELDLIRELRAGIGAPTPEQLAAGHERLWAAIDRSPLRRARRRRSLRVRFLRGAIAAAVAGAAAAVAVEMHGVATPTAPYRAFARTGQSRQAGAACRRWQRRVPAGNPPRSAAVDLQRIRRTGHRAVHPER